VNTTRGSRPIPFALTALVAFFSALVALAVTNGHDAHAHGNGDQHATTHATAADHARISPSELELRQDLRRLWEDHITWTRLAIISLTTDSPDTEATVGRLLENQTDIGDAVKPFYGEAAGNELTRQLRLHILIAADVVAAARAGDQAELAAAQARWLANADDIAAVLASVNPKHWPLARMQAEMHKHLDLTTQEAVARLQGDWSADVAAYDQIHDHILHMSDLLSDGLVKQFPQRFRAS
jgi:hypothetical protein